MCVFFFHSYLRCAHALLQPVTHGYVWTGKNDVMRLRVQGKFLFSNLSGCVWTGRWHTVHKCEMDFSTRKQKGDEKTFYSPNSLSPSLYLWKLTVPFHSKYIPYTNCMCRVIPTKGSIRIFYPYLENEFRDLVVRRRAMQSHSHTSVVT